MATDTPNLTVSTDPVASAASAADDPLWFKDAVIYHAHVKSFFDSNGDGIGDFRGLTEKLDYLHGLGITCLWILPFFPSPLRDDGYDIADYRSVHPSYGTIDDFQAFVDAAHARNIKVLIELVVNHTSDQHPWFQRARHAPAGSPEREFYVWSDTDQKFPETRIIFTDTEKSNWTFDPVARQYYWHRFFSHQPDLNHNNPAVVDAVIDVMKFWLDMGVDALRLDAVPYLCVREGTNNENLPETHAVLRRMRREMDAAYKNRMLLAEANQWPSDVRPYFGDGDECHMAFHFPLMPRMFMALRQEDRHAITEILNQTPDIPETCQWALFLRNHDELTLEMVTDEERDYMYSVYAADPQMRVNVGIRRRLAPLVENSRRRVELLNCAALLVSRHADHLLRRRDRDGRQHLSRRSKRRPHADAVEQRSQRRLLARRSGAALRAGHPGSGLRLPVDQRRGAGALSVLAAQLDEADGRDAQAASRLRPRLARVRRLSQPQGARLPAPRRSRNHPHRRQPRALGAAGRARSEGVRRPAPGGDGRPHRVSADRRAALLPHPRPIRVVLVHAAAGRRPGDRQGDDDRRSRRRDSRVASGAARRRRLAERARRRHARGARAAGAAAVPHAAALVRVEIARDPPGSLHRLGAAAQRLDAGVHDHRVGRIHRRLDRELLSAIGARQR